VRRFLFRVRWPFIGLCFVTALALGYVGFWTMFRGDPNLGPADYLYYAVLLFALEYSGGQEPVSLALHVARFMAPATAAYAAIRAVMLLFDEQLERLMLRFSSHHVVICGLGKHGLQLARDFHAADRRVVVIEPDEANPNLAFCDEHGVVSIIGDARSAETLRLANIARAARLVAVCGDDDVNLGIAVSVHQVLEDVPRREPLLCHLAIIDPRLCHLFKRHRIFGNGAGTATVEAFNTYENAARLLLRDHPLDRALKGPDDPRHVHLVLVGFGKMGQSIALQAAKIGHFANGTRLHVTAIDPAMDARKLAFLTQHPGFDSACDLELLGSECTDPPVLARLREITADLDAVSRFVVCLDSDAPSLVTGLELLDRVEGLPRPVFARMSGVGGLTSLLPGDGGADATDLVPFGMISQTCSRELLVVRPLDAQARAIHEDVSRATSATTSFASDVEFVHTPWEDLPESARDAHRQQADHIAVKLRAIGAEFVPSARAATYPFEFTAAEIDLLARMEHERWAAQQALAEWRVTDHDTALFDTACHVVPWVNLGEDDQDLFREAVRCIPALVTASGGGIRRITSTESLA
jgi:voltage-gated potassium channel Kch